MLVVKDLAVASTFVTVGHALQTHGFPVTVGALDCVIVPVEHHAYTETVFLARHPMKKYKNHEFLLWILSASFALTSCVKEPAKVTTPLPTSTDHTHGAPNPSFVVQDTFLTDTPRLAALRQRYGLDIVEILNNREDRAGVEKIKIVLNRKEVRADTEFFISLNVYLGFLHSGRREYGEATKCWELAEKAAQIDKARYRTSLRFILSNAAILHAYQKQYSEAIRRWKILAEEYQGMGYGDEKNGLAVNAVLQIGRSVRFVPDEADNIKKYLAEVSKAYRGNEVAYVAVVSLYDLSKQAGDQEAAIRYLIELNSYPATSEYRTHSEPVLKKWKEIDAKKQEQE